MSQELNSELEIIKSLYDKNEKLIVFDIGAFNFGEGIVYKQMFPNIEVYAFEPDRFNLSNYRTVAEQAGIYVVPVALSDTDGECIFYSSLGNHTCSGAIIKPIVEEGTKKQKGYNFEFDLDGYSIQTVRFDTFCKLNNINHVNYVHMDTQGAETKVINSLGNMRPDFIFAETCAFDEYETNTNLEEFDSLMVSLGYKIHTRFQYDTLYMNKN
jgi:FkbM family methyltransferase